MATVVGLLNQAKNEAGINAEQAARQGNHRKSREWRSIAIQLIALEKRALREAGRQS